MKSYKEFQESITQEVSGKGLLNFAGNVAKNLGTQPLEKGVKALTSFASMKDEIQDFVKRRKKQIEKRDEQSKLLKKKANKSDVEADKLCADCEKDPDLEKIFRDENPNVVDFTKPNKPKK